MLNNVGLPGIILILVFVVLPIWLLVRSGRRKKNNQARIADALEEIAKNQSEKD